MQETRQTLSDLASVSLLDLKLSSVEEVKPITRPALIVIGS